MVFVVSFEHFMTFRRTVHPQQSSPGSKGYKNRAAGVVSPATQAVGALRLKKTCKTCGTLPQSVAASLDVEEGAHLAPTSRGVRHDPHERHLIPRRSENEPGLIMDSKPEDPGCRHPLQNRHRC